MIVRWKNNDQYLQLIGLKDKKTGAAVNDATVKATFKDKDGVTVGSQLTLNYIAASAGNYDVILQDTVQFPDASAPFTCLVEIDRVGGTHEESVEAVQVMTRKQ